MRRMFAILVSLIPAIYVAAMAVFLFIMPEDEVLFAVLGGIIVVSILGCIGYSVTSAKSSKQSIAVTNLWIIGGNLLLFAAEITWLVISYIQVRIAEQNGGMEGGLGIFLLIIFYLPHWISYLICRCTAAIGCHRSLIDVTGNTAKTLHILLHLIPVFDLISAIWVLLRVKRFHCFQQPPIEN